MKPTVLLDVDGVIADFVTAALDAVHTVTGKRFSPQTIKTWEVFDSLPEEIQRRKDEVYGLLKKPGGCSDIPVYEGAIEGVRKLRDLAHIIVVTSPFSHSPTWMYEREQWLERLFGGEISYVIHTKYKQRVHGDIFIDDKTEHVVGWHQYWQGIDVDQRRRALLWDTLRTKQNNLPPEVTRVTTWEEVHEVARTFPHYD